MAKQKMQQPQTETYIPKERAAEIVGLSVRRLVAYAQAGQVRRQIMRDPKTGRSMSMIHAEDAERLKERLAERREGGTVSAAQLPAVIPAVAQFDPGGPVVTTRIANGTISGGLLESLRPIAEPAAPRLWLTIDEAAEYTGLPADYLLASIVERKELAARNVGRRNGVHGSWRIRRADLDAMAGETLS